MVSILRTADMAPEWDITSRDVDDLLDRSDYDVAAIDDEVIAECVSPSGFLADMEMVEDVVSDTRAAVLRAAGAGEWYEADNWRDIAKTPRADWLTVRIREAILDRVACLGSAPAQAQAAE